MTPQTIEQHATILQQSFMRILPQKDKFITTFYAQLFLTYPQIKPLFANTDMKLQSSKLLGALTLIVNNARKPEVFIPVIKTLGRNHVQYRVRPEHYVMLGDVLLKTLAECLGSAWTPEYHTAWLEAYRTICTLMCEESYLLEKW